MPLLLQLRRRVQPRHRLLRQRKPLHGRHRASAQRLFDAVPDACAGCRPWRSPRRSRWPLASACNGRPVDRCRMRSHRLRRSLRQPNQEEFPRAPLRQTEQIVPQKAASKMLRSDLPSHPPTNPLPRSRWRGSRHLRCRSSRQPPCRPRSARPCLHRVVTPPASARPTGMTSTQPPMVPEPTQDDAHAAMAPPPPPAPITANNDDVQASGAPA